MSDEESLVTGVDAVLLISPNASRLADFYHEVLALPLKDEVHEGVPLHYACDLGGVHFAIHPADGWPGTPVDEPVSPVIALSISNARSAAERLKNAGLAVTGPYDHGFANVVSFRDPDGNHVELLESKAPD